VVVDDVVAGRPVREFRWYRGRRHYSGWYWSSTMGRLVAYESRLELARAIARRTRPGCCRDRRAAIPPDQPSSMVEITE
jgi:hypothetical protein